LHAGQVDHRAIAPGRDAGQVRRERGLEGIRRRMIDAPRWIERHRVGEALRSQLHVGSQGIESGGIGGPILTPGPAVAHWDVLEKSDLLSQLRIDRGVDRPARRRTRLYVLLAAAVLLLGGGPWWCRPRWHARPARAAGPARCSTRAATSPPGARPPYPPRSPAR